jgi:quaternary ammonium compound-resistance protein SugE
MDDLAGIIIIWDDPILLRGVDMSWAILITAGLLEVVWAIGLKYTDGFTRLWPTVATVSAMVLSVWLLGIAMKSLPVGTAYAVWVGIGAIGTAIFGIILFAESANTGRLLSLLLIFAGIVGLKLSTPI